MKEEIKLYSDMSLSRLQRLRNTWLSQIAAAEREGYHDSACRMRTKVALVNQQIDLRKNENLNDLFG